MAVCRRRRNFPATATPQTLGASGDLVFLDGFGGKKLCACNLPLYGHDARRILERNHDILGCSVDLVKMDGSFIQDESLLDTPGEVMVVHRSKEVVEFLLADPAPPLEGLHEESPVPANFNCVIAAVTRDGQQLAFASPELRRNKTIITTAANQCKRALFHADLSGFGPRDQLELFLDSPFSISTPEDLLATSQAHNAKLHHVYLRWLKLFQGRLALKGFVSKLGGAVNKLNGAMKCCATVCALVFYGFAALLFGFSAVIYTKVFEPPQLVTDFLDEGVHFVNQTGIPFENQTAIPAVKAAMKTIGLASVGNGFCIGALVGAVVLAHLLFFGCYLVFLPIALGKLVNTLYETLQRNDGCATWLEHMLLKLIVRISLRY